MLEIGNNLSLITLDLCDCPESCDFVSAFDEILERNRNVNEVIRRGEFISMASMRPSVTKSWSNSFLRLLSRDIMNLSQREMTDDFFPRLLEVLRFPIKNLPRWHQLAIQLVLDDCASYFYKNKDKFMRLRCIALYLNAPNSWIYFGMELFPSEFIGFDAGHLKARIKNMLFSKIFLVLKQGSYKRKCNFNKHGTYTHKINCFIKRE